MPVAPKLAQHTSPSLADYSDAFVLQPVSIKPKKKHRLLPAFFPSKIGGKPVWLVPADYPKDLTCSRCGCLCSFLLQLYVPNEEAPATDDGFHRSLFVFVCHQCGDEFRIFRSQLPLINPHYPPQAPTLEAAQTHAAGRATQAVCKACGLPRHGISGEEEQCSVHVYPEFLVESEEIGNLMHADEEDELSAEALAKELAAMEEICAAMDSGEDDDVPLMEQIEEFGNLELFQNFAEKFPGVVGLYNRQGKLPLWLIEKFPLESFGGRCGICANFREFEFQLLPGLIDKINALDSNLDFAVAAFFTCGCRLSSAYVEEAVVVQKEPDSWWKVVRR